MPLLGDAFLISAMTAGCSASIRVRRALAKPRAGAWSPAIAFRSAMETLGFRSSISSHLRSTILRRMVGVLSKCRSVMICLLKYVQEPMMGAFPKHAHKYVPVGLGCSHPWLQTVLERPPSPTHQIWSVLSGVDGPQKHWEKSASSDILPAASPEPMASSAMSTPSLAVRASPAT